MKAWYDSEGFKAFTMEVDEWEAEIKDKGDFPKAPLKSFRAWRRKKLQGKRQQQKLADRERAKAEKMAAKMKAKGEKLKPKKGKAGSEKVFIDWTEQHFMEADISRLFTLKFGTKWNFNMFSNRLQHVPLCSYRKIHANCQAGAEAPEEPVVLPPLLQKDPFWDTCLDSPEA
jgi:hypothetical protein